MKIINPKRFVIFVIVMTLIIESIIFGVIKLTPKIVDVIMDSYYKTAYCGKYYQDYLDSI